MSRVIWRNRKSIKDREREISQEVDRIHEEEGFEFTRQDILAMIIAGYQVIMPLVIIGAIVFSLFTYVFCKVFLK